MSDNYNKLVKIFHSDCDVIGTIRTNEYPWDITEGEDGLYVVGDDKILVYSSVPDGDFIRRFNVKPSSVKLTGARGICFDCSGHLFVTQIVSGVQGVYVFTPSGELVASFGLASSGVLKNPAGIVIDKDGFVYVCDYSSSNSRVFVF